nr:hypothetical protein [Tanacetum cinerariifolium]
MSPGIAKRKKENMYLRWTRLEEEEEVVVVLIEEVVGYVVGSGGGGVSAGGGGSLRNIVDVDFLWKETRLRQLMSSPGAPCAGPLTPLNYSSGPSKPPSYSSGPSTPPNYSSGSSRNAECSNCKYLRGKISVLMATMNIICIWSNT